MDNEPLFILAPPRSFTSLVNVMIGQHPALYGLPELNLFLADTMKEFWIGRGKSDERKNPYWPIMRHGLLRTVAQLYAGEQTLDTIAMAFRWIMARKDMGTGEVYKLLCHRIHPLILVDKSPAYIGRIQNLKRLYSSFPKARFIHLIRHPRGQCESVLNAKGGMLMLMMAGSVDLSGDEPVIDPQLAWFNGHIQIMNFLDTIPKDQWIRVMAEDILVNQEEELSKLCSWLNLASGKYEIGEMKHPENSPFACVGPFSARLGNDINFLRSPALRPVRVKKYDLHESLPWRPDNKPFQTEIINLANEFGYD
jgi:hypothetical protein